MNILLDVAKRQNAKGKYNDAALMIIRYKFHDHFDLVKMMLLLADLNKLETAKMLIAHDD